MGRDSRRRPTDAPSASETHYPPPLAATHPTINANATTRWSLPSDTSVPLLDLHHRVPVSISSLALDRELEMDLEASDNTFRRHEDAALRVSEHNNPFSSSRLQPFHHMSEHAVATAMALCRSRGGTCSAITASNTNATNTNNANNAKTNKPNAKTRDQWKLVKEQADIRVYRNATRRGKTTSMMAQGMVRGSLAEILDGLYAETTKEAKVLYPLLSDAFLDISVLHVDSYRTAQHPYQFAGVTWMALETPRGGYGVCKDRDFVCFKKMGVIKDPESATDDDIGFLTLLSVDQSEVPPSHYNSTAPFAFNGSEFVRGYLSLTAFFKKLPNGLVSLVVSGDFNARGHLTARLADHMFADLVFAVGNAAKCGQAKSLAMLLQSITAGQQLPPSGNGYHVTASASGSHVSQLLPLLLEKKNRDRCGVCSKTLWRMLERPEYCRSCWTRTCRNCHVTMPIYCADFHRAHDDDGSSNNGLGPGPSTSTQGSVSVAAGRKRRFKRLPKPCKETFCLKCVCSVLPNGIKMNAKLLKQTAKKKKYFKKHGGSMSMVTADASLLRRGMGRTAASARYVPSVVHSGGSVSDRHRNGNIGGGSGGSSRNGREPGKLYVQLPRPHHHLRSRGTPSSNGTGGDSAALSQRHDHHHHIRHHHFDSHSSISAMSSVESEKLMRQRLSLNKSSGPKMSPPSDSTIKHTHKKQKALLEPFQSLSHQTTTMSADYSEPLHDDDDDDGGLSYNSYSSIPRLGGVSHPSGYPPIAPSTRKLQLRVNLTPRKRARRSSTASSSLGGSQTSSKHTYAASSLRQSPHVSSNQHVPSFDEAYYNQALQRYLEKRRSSLRTNSSTMSGDLFESLDKASAEATARAAAMIGGRAIGNGTTLSTSGSSSVAGRGVWRSHGRGSSNGNSGDAHKLRILRDLEPFPRTPSFLDRPRTPSRMSISSLSSCGSSSDTATDSGRRLDQSSRSQGDWVSTY